MAGIFEKIVKHRFIVLAAAAVLTAVCAVLMTRVEVNTDMTRYLPDDSNMKQGVDILAEEFPDMENRNTIRVMFTGVDDSQADDIYRELESIRYVSEVMYDAGSEDYVKGDKRLFVLVTPYDYESPEEKYIIEQVSSQFEDYEMEVKDDNANSSYIPVYVLILAVCLLFLIMVVMCASWLEPVLFMVTIGTAIVINMGTNLFLDNVANITYAVAAILQLVLSMDYSIILSNRYRQEKLLERNRKDAMAKALHKAFSSVCSSSLTTFVGLLCLVFMSFKIGFNLGIVLAKGVICSLVCVLTVLPALLLLFDGGVEKTAKKRRIFRQTDLRDLNTGTENRYLRHLFCCLRLHLFCRALQELHLISSMKIRLQMFLKRLTRWLFSMTMILKTEYRILQQSLKRTAMSRKYSATILFWAENILQPG